LLTLKQPQKNRFTRYIRKALSTVVVLLSLHGANASAATSGENLNGDGNKQQAINDAEWLLKQSPQSYAIQIVTLSSAQQIQDLVNEQSLSGFARFRYKSDNQLRYVLTYGVYATPEAAEAGSQLLIEKLQGFNATPTLWVRELMPIQKSIRTTLQN
jgi:septal ring-binding cell division protein DamX|tara:strand:- start:786 stop:1256 length:471 start_codon:yes stop_codon:yes gene_type:complete